MARGTGYQIDKSRTDGQEVTDLTHSDVDLAQDDKETAQSHKNINRKSKDWVGKDITAITETRQQAHIHQSGKSSNVLLFPRAIQGTTALITATAKEREDDDT